MFSGYIDEQKLKDIATKTVAEFGEKYAKTYPVALLKKVVEDAKAEDGGPAYQLLSRPEAEKNKDPIKTGWGTKLGAVVKNWKKRFFVVRYDYKIEYYDKEETYKKGGAPKGTINPAGYTVEANPEATLAQRLEKLAAKLKLDVSSLSKPQSVPPITVALMKERRRDWYIQFETEAQKQEWIPVLKQCTRKAEGLNSQDPVAREAYRRAFAATRHKCGYYDYWNFDGSEEQNLTDLIARQLNEQVLGEFYEKIEEAVSNAKMRSMADDKVEGLVGSTVGGIVSSAWSAAARGVEAARGPIEAKLKGNVDKLVAAQKGVSEKMTELVSDKIDPVASRLAKPFAEVALPLLLTPVTAALKLLIAVFDSKAGEAANSISLGQDENQLWRELSRMPWLWSTMSDVWDRLHEADKLLEKADAFADLKFGVQQLEAIISTAFAAVQKLLDNAFYTLEHEFAAHVKGGKNKPAAVKDALASTRAKLLRDCVTATGALVQGQLLSVVMAPIKSDVLEPCKEVMGPVVDAIPDLLKDVLNPDDVLEETVTSIVGNVLDAIIKPSLPSFS